MFRRRTGYRNLWYAGKRNTYRRIKWYLIIIIITVAVLLLSYINKKISPAINAAAEYKATSLATALVYRSVNEKFSKNVDYNELSVK